jgi:hypothetical protein
VTVPELICTDTRRHPLGTDEIGQHLSVCLSKRFGGVCRWSDLLYAPGAAGAPSFVIKISDECPSGGHQFESKNR